MVRRKLLDAAIDLFSREGNPSGRAVAKRAGVNHGLIHHYMGGKAGLQRAVLDRVVEVVYSDFGRDPEDDHEADPEDDELALAALSREAMARTRRDPRFVRILARVLLDAEPDEPEELAAPLQSAFPVVSRLRRLGTEARDDHARAERADAALAEGLALALGSVIFAPWIRAALDMDAERFDDIIDRALARVHASRRPDTGPSEGG